MSDAVRIALIGATGLVGSSVIGQCVGREDLRLTGIARREVALPRGIRMELFVAEPAKWGEVIEAVQPKAIICALGTTWKKAGADEAAFRAVDQDLVLDTARAARELGVERFVHISSVGADPMVKPFYLRVKGEVERELTKLRFNRLDILRPGLLRGTRKEDLRPLEGLGRIASPAMDLLLHGKYTKYRSVHASLMAEAILSLAMRKTQGKFLHEHEALHRTATTLPRIEG